MTVTMSKVLAAHLAPKPRVRTPVGYRYLDVLQSQERGTTARSEASSTPSRHSTDSSYEDQEDEGLDLLVLGITSGTMMDDIDFALCRFTQATPETPLYLDLIQYDSVTMPSKIRSEVLSLLMADTAPPSMLSQMDVELGHTFANATHIFAKRHSICVDDIDLIGSGGQLVSLTGKPPLGQHRANMCLGEGAVICAKTGVTTVSDFRTTEQAVGRQGAPLFANLVGLLLHHPTRLQICITIGGISTVCFIPSDDKGGIDAMYDWDTGPGTVLLDAAFRYFNLDTNSVNGIHPSSISGGSGLSVIDIISGQVDQDIINEILATSAYLALRPPKTTAREIFSDAMAHSIIASCLSRNLSIPSILATLTHLTTATLISQLHLYGPGRNAINNADIVLDGRGASNPYFLSALRNEFPNASFGSLDRTGVPSNAKKAVGFAMQAMEAILGRARPVPRNADVRRPNTITGKVAPGVRWREVVRKSVGGVFAGRGGWEGLPEVRELRVRNGGMKG